jgi:mRNA-degrading endonuclease toxin of MazEF toxin-antitoxin module
MSDLVGLTRKIGSCQGLPTIFVPVTNTRARLGSLGEVPIPASVGLEQSTLSTQMRCA